MPSRLPRRRYLPTREMTDRYASGHLRIAPRARDLVIRESIAGAPGAPDDRVRTHRAVSPCRRD